MHLTLDEILEHASNRDDAFPSHNAPGDSIGMTTFDFWTNGSVPQNYTNYSGTQLPQSIVTTMASEPDWSDVGAYYATFQGSTWSDFVPFGSRRRSGTSVTQVDAAGGIEVAVSSRGDSVELCVNTGIQWVCFPAPQGYWPRIASDDNFRLYLVSCDADPPSHVRFASTDDLGVTWTADIELFSHPGLRVDADGYDIAASGSRVAVICAGQGGDVVLVESTDYGNTWEERVIGDVAGQGELPFGQEEWQPDGACALVYDGSGVLHAVWSSFLAIGDREADPVLYYSYDAGLTYWSEQTGIERMVPYHYCCPEEPPPVGRDGNYVSEPDISASYYGSLIITFVMSMTEDGAPDVVRDRIWGGCKNIFSWSVDVVTEGRGFSAPYHSLPPSFASEYDEMHLWYASGSGSGSSVTGNHPVIPTVLRDYFRRIPCIIPEEKLVKQESSRGTPISSYPNPFNASTTIRYEIGSREPVVISVFDLLGREVAVLVNETKSPGRYETTWGATGYPSGVYFLRIHAGDFAHTKKLVVLR
jgi:hypothetical protein